MERLIQKLRGSRVAHIHAVAILTAILVWAIYGEWTGLKGLHFIGYDYTFFYYAFQTVIHHQNTMYLYNIHRQHMYLQSQGYPVIRYDQYVYPPQFAVLFSFLGRLSFQASMWTWMMANIVSYGLGVFFTARVIFSKITREGGLLIGFAALIMTPFHIDAGVGNVNSFIFCMIALAFYLIHRANKPLLAGIPLALAVICKVTPIAILVLLVLRKRWRTNLSALVTLLLVSAVTVSILGFHTITMYVSRFASFGHTSMKNGPAPYNQSLIGVLGMFVSHHAFHLSVQTEYDCFFAVSLIVGLMVLSVARKSHLSPGAEFALAGVVPLLFSPLVEEMHLMLAIPAIFYVIEAGIAYTHRGQIKVGTGLIGAGIVSIGLLSLPATFALNMVVRHFPNLYFVQTQMWWVMVILVTAIFWLCMRPKRRAERHYELGLLPGKSFRD